LEIKNNILTIKDILTSIKLSSTNMSKIRQKFVEDVVKASYIARKSSLESNIELKDFTKIPLTKLGEGTEHVVYDYNDSVLKISKGIRISPTKSNRYTKNNVYERCSFYSVESLILDSVYYLKQVNSYWYQEPLCLIGYYKHCNRFVPVYKQRKLKYTAEIETEDSNKKAQIKYLIPKKDISNTILNNNIFKENDLLPPLDCNLNNFMFDERGILHAIDIK
jgi:hypothetical protein